MRSCQALPFLKIWLEARHPLLRAPPPPLPPEKGGANYVSAITKNVISVDSASKQKILGFGLQSAD